MISEERSHGNLTPTVTTRVQLPANVPMVSLLGPDDEVLRAIEAGFSDLDIHARGNLITLTGATARVDLAEQLIDELGASAAPGEPLAPAAAGRAPSLRTAAAERPAHALTPTS